MWKMVNAQKKKCWLCRSVNHLQKSCDLYRCLEEELAANVGIVKSVRDDGSGRWVCRETGHFASSLDELVDMAWLIQVNSKVWNSRRKSSDGVAKRCHVSTSIAVGSKPNVQPVVKPEPVLEPMVSKSMSTTLPSTTRRLPNLKPLQLTVVAPKPQRRKVGKNQRGRDHTLASQVRNSVQSVN